MTTPSIYLRLAYEFFKAGLFSIGGGLATLPFLQEISDTTGWYTRADLANMIAISESTPGPLGVNMATYVGYTTGGVLGGAIATLSLITPSIIVILLISKFLDRFKTNPLVENTFYGLRPASTGLIAAAGFEVIKITFINFDAFQSTNFVPDLFAWKSMILAVVLIIAIKKIKWHPVFFIAASAAIGIVFQFAGA